MTSSKTLWQPRSDPHVGCLMLQHRTLTYLGAQKQRQEGFADAKDQLRQVESAQDVLGENPQVCHSLKSAMIHANSSGIKRNDNNYKYTRSSNDNHHNNNKNAA